MRVVLSKFLGFVILVFALTTPLVAGFVKIPPVAQPPVVDEEPSYQKLVCTEEDRQNIGYIITTMAENGLLTLYFQYKGDLTHRGAEIVHVHPLRFLGVIFSDPNLKECMKKIFPSNAKRDRFMRDLKG